MDLSEAIRERLAALEPQSMDLLDESGKHAGHAGAKAGGSHFRLTIVSRRFSGKDQIPGTGWSMSARAADASRYPRSAIGPSLG
jgi:hypothetical protein